MPGVATTRLRIHFRYLLPLLFLPLSAALFFVGRQQRRGIEVGSWDGPPPHSTEIASMALNIPAGIAAIPGGLLLELITGGFGRAHRAEWQDAVGYFYLAVFVFEQWFLIGRWLDRRRGLVRFSTSRWIPRNSRIVNAVALLGSLFFTCFGIWQMRHSGWMSSWIPGAGITAWGLIAAIASTLRLRWLFRSVGEDAPHQTR
jgi:hypothetical protein